MISARQLAPCNELQGLTYDAVQGECDQRRLVGTSGVRAGDGASSSSFWFRRWMLQSRSKRWMTSPCLSANTCKRQEMRNMSIESSTALKCIDRMTSP